MRQGFAAALLRDDGSGLVASGARWEQSVLYAVDGDRVVLGIHPADVICRLRRPPALDVAKLADAAALYDDAERTVFEGVRRVPRGGLLHLAPGRPPRPGRWWRPSTEQDHDIRPAEAVDLMRSAVRGAVEASLPPTGAVAATLSGGLDSTVVVGLAGRLLAPQGRPIHAMTHVPLPGTPSPHQRWEADDGPYAEAMARSLPGVTWEPVVNTALVSPLEADEWAFRRTWQPSFNPSNHVWINAMIRTAEERGDSLLLTGAFGNASFSRDADGIVRGLVRDRRFGAVLRQVRARRAADGADGSWSAAARGVAREGLPERVMAWQRAARRLPPTSRAPGLGTADLAYRRERVSDEAVAHFPLLDEQVAVTRAHWVDFVTSDESRAGAVQNLSDTVWWSDPLSDHEVVELALRLPEEAWIASGWDRGLARSVGEGLVPDRVRLRSTYGSQGADVHTWVAGREASYLELVERMRASVAVPEFLDLDRLAAAVGPELADPTTALQWQGIHGRAFALGGFALWYEEEVLAPAARGEWPFDPVG